ncbi:hypothetical protein SALINJAH_209 [Bacillus phage SalinJah]|uniref:Uncharacterized protein n=1 Tax=Bacillus phage SalinJah TaxID=1837830 RepID=A0A173GBS3_9CAUD|nr:hypothetical protein SALINJAH_209 [Bacillus phage SalinJah]ANH50766.1 hypothetical protein SALINJAH_209 [Bacillus phage SalinJah]
MRYKILREVETASALMGAIALGYTFSEFNAVNSGITIGFVVLSLAARMFKGEKPNA